MKRFPPPHLVCLPAWVSTRQHSSRLPVVQVPSSGTKRFVPQWQSIEEKWMFFWWLLQSRTKQVFFSFASRLCPGLSWQARAVREEGVYQLYHPS